MAEGSSGDAAPQSLEVEEGIAEARLSEEQQKAAVGKVWRNLMPVMYVSALLSYLDRSNLSYAALELNEGACFPSSSVRADASTSCPFPTAHALRCHCYRRGRCFRAAAAAQPQLPPLPTQRQDMCVSA